MTKDAHDRGLSAARADARNAETEIGSTDPYPPGTEIRRPNRPNKKPEAGPADGPF